MALMVNRLTHGEILNESARELAGETVRWFDLVRPHPLLYRVTVCNPDAKNTIQPFHVLRPIPRTKIDRTTTSFPQNPGY